MGISRHPAGSVATVALDASVLINFLILNRVGILADLSTAATLPSHRRPRFVAGNLDPMFPFRAWARS